MTNYFLSLDPFDLIIVEGEDARTFLQGQVSCNIDDLAPETTLVGALCNIKGRVIADFRIVDIHEKLCLQMQPGMANKVLEVLSKYIVFSKATIRKDNQLYSRYGLLGENADALLETLVGAGPIRDNGLVSIDDALVINVSGTQPRFEIWVPHSQSQSAPIIQTLQEKTIPAEQASWTIEDLRSKTYHVDPDSSEQYLPENLNYDLSGVINFNKGCYTGQEIVARMHYRGEAKKRLYHGLVKDSASLSLPVNQVSDGNKESHPVLASARTETGDCHLLAILPVDKAQTQGEFSIDGLPVTFL